MRILFLSHYDNMYGANRALLDLILGLKREGKHEAILVLPAEGELTERLKEEGVEYYICPVTQWQAIYREPISFALKKRKRLKAIVAETQELYEHFKDRGIDLIHSNSSVIGSGAMLAERLGCKHVWHIREFSREHYGMRYFCPAWMVKHYYEAADRLVVISDALKENYAEKYPGARIERIYDGVEKRPQPAEEKEEGPLVRFVYVAYLFPKKQQLELLKAFAELKEENVRDFSLVLAGGGDAAYEKKLRAFIKKKGLCEAELAGFVSDVPSLLRDSDVGIMASDHEGFGLVTVEYMLAGLPVIGYDSGATPEIVKDGETGILYRDREGLKRAVKTLLRNVRERRNMGHAAYWRAVRMFSAEANTAAIQELYRTLDKGDGE